MQFLFSSMTFDLWIVVLISLFFQFIVIIVEVKWMREDFGTKLFYNLISSLTQ